MIANLVHCKVKADYSFDFLKPVFEKIGASVELSNGEKSRIDIILSLQNFTSTFSIYDTSKKSQMQPPNGYNSTHFFLDFFSPNLATDIHEVLNLCVSKLKDQRLLSQTKDEVSNFEKLLSDFQARLHKIELEIIEVTKKQAIQQDISNQMLKFVSQLQQVDSLHALTQFIEKWIPNLFNSNSKTKIVTEKDEHFFEISTKYFEDNLYFIKDSKNPKWIVPILSNSEIVLLFEFESSYTFSEMEDRLLSLQSLLKIRAQAILLESEYDEFFSIWHSALNSIQRPMVIYDNSKLIFKNSAFEQRISENPESLRIDEPVSERFINGHIYEISSTQLKKQNSIYKVAYFRDINEDRTKFIDFIQYQKLNLINSLGKKIAHELSNPIGGIQALIQVIISDTALTNQQKADLTQVYESSNRALQIIKSLQNYSNQDTSLHLNYDLHQLINEALVFTKSIQRSMKIKTLFKGRGPLVKVEGELFKQVVFNLIQNATHACSGRGIIEIETEITGNHHAILKLSDNGPGIAQEHQKNLFLPLFSTKKIGQGTGLGLAFIKASIESWNGTIRYNSDYTPGAQFIIELPISSNE